MTEQKPIEDDDFECRINDVFAEAVEQISKTDDLSCLSGPLTLGEKAPALVRALARRVAMQYILRGEVPPPHIQAVAGTSGIDRHPNRKVHSSPVSTKWRRLRKRFRIRNVQKHYRMEKVLM
jgi:hypothetical protein